MRRTWRRLYLRKGNLHRCRGVLRPWRRCGLSRFGVLGPDPGGDKEISILNRIVRWEKDHLRYEADPRHVEKLARGLGMEGCKSLTTPGTKPTTSSTILDDGLSGCGIQLINPEPLKLEHQGMKLYRSAVARCNYLAADRYETAFTTKELCRSIRARRLTNWGRYRDFADS